MKKAEVTHLRSRRVAQLVIINAAAREQRRAAAFEIERTKAELAALGFDEFGISNAQRAMARAAKGLKP